MSPLSFNKNVIISGYLAAAIFFNKVIKSSSDSIKDAARHGMETNSKSVAKDAREPKIY